MKTTVFVGISVDGFLARPDGTFDFLFGGGVDSGADNGYDDFIVTVDALLMGRHTFDVVRAFEKWPYGDKPVFVLSTKPLAPSNFPVERLEGEPADVLAQLAQKGFTSIYVDGGLTIQRFLRAGLVDRMVITRLPVLVGEGIPLFGPLAGDVRLKHVETKVIGEAAVQSTYEVVR